MAGARSSVEAALAAEVESTPYRYLKQLAGGAMGEVVLVEHVELGERRVMKLLRSNLADVEELALRMRTEARVLTKLDNPHVVRVHDFGRTQAGRPYMVMEALAGCTLKELVKQEGPRPVADAVEITRQMLKGLKHVHRLGVVHRDMKPDNVFYCRSAAQGTAEAVQVKILDFGIVRVVEDEVRAKLGHLPATAEGMLVGTPAYLAPEQAIGLRVGPSADLYSTGAILWFLLVGKPPFQAESQYDLLRAHVMDPPAPPSSQRADLHRWAGVKRLDTFVLRALEKKPEDRFASAEEMLEALERLEFKGAWVPEPSDADEATVRGLPLVAMPSTVAAAMSSMSSSAAVRPTIRMSDEDVAALEWLSNSAGPGPLTAPNSQSAAQAPSPARAQNLVPVQPTTERANMTQQKRNGPSAAFLFWGKLAVALLTLLIVVMLIVILLQRMNT